MKNILSLKNSREFSRVYTKKCSFANKLLVMYVCPNETESIRLGISVSKKVGNSVVRHRTVRLIRESFRLNCTDIKKGYDIVVVARPFAKDKSFGEIESAFLHLIRLHKIDN